MTGCLRQRSKKRIKRILNNKGVTLAEMLVTFILLGFFMVAATRVISYTVGIYYASKGNINGYQVSSMLYDKLSREIENAIGGEKDAVPTVSADGALYVRNQDNNVISIGLTKAEADADGNRYLKIHYAPTVYLGVKYNDVDWLYDKKAYLGYSIKELKFEDPNRDAETGNLITDAEGNLLYDKNVIRVKLVVKSPKYGEFPNTYYMRCFRVDEIRYN